jgi:hypothetical protein
MFVVPRVDTGGLFIAVAQTLQSEFLTPNTILALTIDQG